MEKKALGCTAAQRRWVLERDQYRCQMFLENGRMCGRTYGLMVHHVVPRGYASMHLSTKDPNVPENLITLCPRCHIGKGLTARERYWCLHPDTEVARMLYQAGDKEAYRKMADRRRELNVAGIPYWNTHHDAALRKRAWERNKVMTRPFPYRNNDMDRLELEEP